MTKYITNDLDGNKIEFEANWISPEKNGQAFFDSVQEDQFYGDGEQMVDDLPFLCDRYAGHFESYSEFIYEYIFKYKFSPVQLKMINETLSVDYKKTWETIYQLQYEIINEGFGGSGHYIVRE